MTANSLLIIGGGGGVNGIDVIIGSAIFTDFGRVGEVNGLAPRGAANPLFPARCRPRFGDVSDCLDDGVNISVTLCKIDFLRFGGGGGVVVGGGCCAAFGRPVGCAKGFLLDALRIKAFLGGGEVLIVEVSKVSGKISPISDMATPISSSSSSPKYASAGFLVTIEDNPAINPPLVRLPGGGGGWGGFFDSVNGLAKKNIDFLFDLFVSWSKTTSFETDFVGILVFGVTPAIGVSISLWWNLSFVVAALEKRLPIRFVIPSFEESLPFVFLPRTINLSTNVGVFTPYTFNHFSNGVNSRSKLA